MKIFFVSNLFQIFLQLIKYQNAFNQIYLFMDEFKDHTDQMMGK